MTIKFAVTEQFISRPTLRCVARNLLRGALSERYAGLTLEPEELLVTGLPAGQSRRTETTLVDSLLEHFIAQSTPRWSAAEQALMRRSTGPAGAPLVVDVSELAVLVDRLASGLGESFSQALADFWSESTDWDGEAVTRWGWLARQLRQRYPHDIDHDDSGLTPQQKQALREAVNVPDSDRQAPLQPGIACVSLTPDPDAGGFPLPALVFVDRRTTSRQLLVYRLCGQFQHFSEQGWDVHLQQQFVDDRRHLRWALQAPRGDVFETLAQAVLEAQLNALERYVQGSDASVDVAAVERYFEAATDVAALFVAPPDTHAASRLEPALLPDWLSTAGDADRIGYSRSMAALAALQARTQGKAFDDGLPSIRSFAATTLRENMLAEQPEGKYLPLAEVELVINKVTAVAVGLGGQMNSLGEVETVRMSLLDFALENLVGLPVGTITVRRTSGLALPHWMTVDFVRHLVQVADIGGVYPELLRHSLITDVDEAERRRRLFCEQLRIQLPLKAMEQKLRGQGGITGTGCAMIQALMQPGSQSFGGQPVVLRPLAFIASANRHADTVANMFSIGPQDVASGPHLLYRPFEPVPLIEFGSWSALLAAVVTPGELQQKVLHWLSDNARAVYAEGGFSEPHIVRFGLGSEFAPLAHPEPATLCSDPVSGDPLQALYGAAASALVELADRGSVSNAESRWATLKEGGWLLLNALLPILGNSLANSVWLLQLLNSVDTVAAMPEGADSPTRSAAIADLLLNIALIVLHQGIEMRGWAQVKPLVASAPVPTADALPAPALRSAEFVTANTRLDFSWSSPASQLTATQRARLSAFEVHAPPILGNPITSGADAGLCLSQGGWYARVDEHVYRVMPSEDGVIVVNPDDPTISGPWLQRTAQGWRVDLGLRLRGGGPKQNARKLAEANAQNAKRVNDRLAQLQLRSSELVKATRAYSLQLGTARGKLRQLFIDRYEADLNEFHDLVQEQVRLWQELRPGDRPSEKDVAGGLRAMARQICYLEGLLLNDLQALASQELERMKTLTQVVAVVPENSAAYFEMFRNMAAIQVKSIRWASVREAVWEQLRNVPKVGETMWRDEVLEVYSRNHPSALESESNYMFSILELVFSNSDVIFSDDLNLLKELRNDLNLHAAIASHVEVEKPNDHSLEERIGVIESALKEYEKAADVASYIHFLDYDGVKGHYLEQFIAQINALRDKAMQRLDVLIRENAEASMAEPQGLPKFARSGARVIKTRSQRTLLGSVREGAAEFDGEVVDVTDALTSKVIQSWHQHADGAWVEVVEARPELAEAVAAKGPAISMALLTELQEQADVLLGRVEPSVRNAWRQSGRANEPADMEDILLQKAEKLTELATRMRPYSTAAHVPASVASQVAAQLQQLATAADRLRAQGREIRIAMIKAQPPTAGRISYLHQQGEVNIASFDGRKNMSGARRDDFVQEFAIRDTDNRVLWWAHFHYSSQDALAEAYQAAHLKLPSQRFLGYKALIRAARAGGEVVSIYRSSIGKEIAQKLFLPLTP